MAKKDFSSIGANIGSGSADRVYSSLDQATTKRGQQNTATAQEQYERKNALKTQGRKGCKAIRINMAFSPENHEFIRVMSKATGHTMTEFTNIIIKAYRNEHPEFMEQAQNFLEFVESGAFSAIDSQLEDN